MNFLAFRSMATPILIQIIYWFATVIVIVGGLAVLILGNNSERFLGFLALILGPLVIRICAELAIVLFKMNETLTEIKNNTERD
jgi:hypothetical protein